MCQPSVLLSARLLDNWRETQRFIASELSVTLSIKPLYRIKHLPFLLHFSCNTHCSSHTELSSVGAEELRLQTFRPGPQTHTACCWTAFTNLEPFCCVSSCSLWYTTAHYWCFICWVAFLKKRPSYNCLLMWCMSRIQVLLLIYLRFCLVNINMSMFARQFGLNVPIFGWSLPWHETDL